MFVGNGQTIMCQGYWCRNDFNQFVDQRHIIEIQRVTLDMAAAHHNAMIFTKLSYRSSLSNGYIRSFTNVCDYEISK